MQIQCKGYKFVGFASWVSEREIHQNKSNIMPKSIPKSMNNRCKTHATFIKNSTSKKHETVFKRMPTWCQISSKSYPNPIKFLMSPSLSLPGPNAPEQNRAEIYAKTNQRSMQTMVSINMKIINKKHVVLMCKNM